MPSQKNIDQVKIIQEKLEKAKSVVLADYKGLSVEQQQKLRNSLKENDAELTVTKNRLLLLALKNENFPLPESHSPITEATITLFSFKDEIAPLKTLYEFAQANEIPKIKFGFLGQEFLEKERIEELAQLPSRQQLQARVVTTLASPIRRTLFVLQANLNKLIMVLEEIKKQKSSS